MFISILYMVFKFILWILSIVSVIGTVIIGVIFIGALTKALPVVGILLALIVLSVAVYYIIMFVNDKKEKKLYKQNLRNSYENISPEIKR